MTFYDYKVTPAPRRLKRIKGVKSTSELFATTLAEAINLAAREGWEYVRAETLPAEEAGGWFRRSVEVVETVLVFRRPREQLGPRLASARPEDETDAPRLGAVERSGERVAERPVERGPDGPDERASPLRREPRLAAMTRADTPTPLRTAPRLGPADQL